MSRTFLRQDTQILSSSLYNDKLASGVELVSSSFTIEDDLNALRSQVNRLISGYSSGSTEWVQDIPATRNVGDLCFLRFALWGQSLYDYAVIPSSNTVPNGGPLKFKCDKGSSPALDIWNGFSVTGSYITDFYIPKSGYYDLHITLFIHIGEIINPIARTPPEQSLIYPVINGIVQEGHSASCTIPYNVTTSNVIGFVKHQLDATFLMNEGDKLNIYHKNNYVLRQFEYGGQGLISQLTLYKSIW
jgi:hypothetical protein